MIRTNSDNQIILYIQEPDEEMLGQIFIRDHSPTPKPIDWDRLVSGFINSEEPRLTAIKCGYRGGYDTAIANMLWQHMGGV